MKIEAAATIERPVEAVWEFMAEPSNNPKWDPGTLEVRQTSEGPIGVGTTLIAVVEFLGRRELGVRITSFEPHHEFRFEFVSGPVTGTRTRYAVDRLDAARTRLTRSVDLRLRGWWTLLWPLLAWSARRHRADEVSNVKRILEAERSDRVAPTG